MSGAGARDLARLFKLPISALSALSAATGYVAWARGVGWGLLPMCAAVFLLACGASALNEAQEHREDALMDRTKARPIPAGRISPGGAWIAGGLVGTIGLALLYWSGGRTAALLGAAAITWYNGVYTPLKRVTAFAVVPGALVGVAAPAIGWVAAHGSIKDGRLLALCFFWLMWQVPHFSLLVMKNGDEYERAGLPTLAKVFSPPQLARASFVWIAATAVSALLIPVFGVSQSPWVGIALAVAGAVLCAYEWRQLWRRAFAGAFYAMSSYAVIVVAVVIVDAVW
jgi:protoheme IX farnesyltransferase